MGSPLGIYIVSFKLSPTHAYQDRLDRFLAEIQRGTWWGESGTVMICESEETIDEFCDRILHPDSFDPIADIAVVFDLESGDGRTKGRLRDYGLYTIIPWIKRL